MDHPSQQLQERRKALAEKALRDEEMLKKHVRAILALRDPVIGVEVRREAMARVERWEEKKLCHQIYIENWRRILANPNMDELRAEILAEGHSAIALRQNTPFSPRALSYEA